MLMRNISGTLLMICLILANTPALSGWKDGCQHNGCGYTKGVSNCSTCQCADLGRHRNTCISDARYCEAFGNPGGR